MAVVRQVQQRLHGVKLGNPAQIGVFARAEPADALGQAAGQMLQTQRVGVAGRLKGRPGASLRPAPGFS